MPPSNPNTTSKICAACKSAIKTRYFLSCSKCKLHYDGDCVGAIDMKQMDVTKRAEWKCPECQNKQPKLDNTNTPVRNVQPSLPASDGQQRIPGASQDILSSNGTFANDFNKLKVELSEVLKTMMDTCMAQLSAKIDSLSLAFSTVNARMEAVEERVSAIELNLEQKSTSESSVLADTVDRLKEQLNHRDQQLLLNDVEMSGLPETSGENPTNLVTLVGSKLGVTIVEQDIVSAMRVGTRREHNGNERPRVLVLRVVRRELRERLLNAARERRGANTKGLQLPGAAGGVPCQLYINERLTKTNRQLLFLARQESKRLQWRHPWTRDGGIYVRRTQKDSPQRIRSELDIQQVFGAKATGCA